MFHEPARRLGTEENANTQDERWNECRSELEAPCDVAGVFDDDVGAESQENAWNYCQMCVSGKLKLAVYKPATTQSCQNITSAPRMRWGAISAE